MEVDAVRRGELHRARLYTPGGWRDAVRAAEGPRERLVGRVAGLEGDVEHADVAGDEPVRRALEPDPPAKPARRLARRRADRTIQLRPGHVHPRGQLTTRRSVVVEARRHEIDEPGKRIRVGSHARNGREAGLPRLIVLRLFSR